MNKQRWIAALVAVGVAAVAIFGVWYFVFRDDSPPAVSLEVGYIVDHERPALLR